MSLNKNLAYAIMAIESILDKDNDKNREGLLRYGIMLLQLDEKNSIIPQKVQQLAVDMISVGAKTLTVKKRELLLNSSRDIYELLPSWNKESSFSNKIFQEN